MYLIEEIDKYLKYCECQKELDEKTITAYRIDLAQFISLLSDTESIPTKEQINQYLTYIHQEYKQKTVKRKIASVKAFFNYLEDEEIIELNPFHKIKTKFKEDIILPKIIPRDTIEKLLDYLYSECDARKGQPQRILLRDLAVVETLFSTGIRISELCSLQDKYIDLNSGILCIQGKGGKERYLQIGNNDVLEVLKKYKDTFMDAIEKHGYFFVNRYGQPLSENSARIMIQKYAQKIDADIHITPHMFRHSFATYLMEEDVNIRYIQKMLGHSSITTTQIYTYVTTEKEKEILQTKHPRNKMNVGKKWEG